MRGRPKKPTNLKVLEGNPGKRPLPQNEPKPLPISPMCPTWLNADAKRMWKKLVPALEKMRLVTSIDGEALAAACQSYGIWVECEKYFKKKDDDGKLFGRTYLYENKNGSVNELPRPQVAIGNKALSEFRAFCSEFGLSPASRTRIEIPKFGEEDDPMERLLRNQGG